MEIENHNKFKNFIYAVGINLGKWLGNAEVVVQLKHILTDIIQHLCQPTKNLRLEGQDAPLRIRMSSLHDKDDQDERNTQQHWCIIALILVVNYQKNIQV